MQNPNQARERFSKRLTQNEVEKCLILFPFSAVAGIVNFEEGRQFCLDAVDSIGKAWTFPGSFHSNEEMGSFVSISLPQFMSEKALKANDEVVFIRQSPDDNKAASWKRFKIEVKRKIRLLGQDIWGELMV